MVLNFCDNNITHWHELQKMTDVRTKCWGALRLLNRQLLLPLRLLLFILVKYEQAIMLVGVGNTYESAGISTFSWHHSSVKKSFQLFVLNPWAFQMNRVNFKSLCNSWKSNDLMSSLDEFGEVLWMDHHWALMNLCSSACFWDWRHSFERLMGPRRFEPLSSGVWNVSITSTHFFVWQSKVIHLSATI